MRSELRLANERRRLATALTRARNALVASWSRQRNSASPEPHQRNRFLSLLLPYMTDESTPNSDDPTSYDDLDPHYYRRNLRTRQSGGAPSPSPTEENAAAVAEGRRVEHGKYGVGTVLSVEELEDRRIAEIDFESAGVKKVNLNYTTLEIVG